MTNNYLDVKSEFPNFQFIVRECEGADALVIARYRYGVERKEYLTGLSEDEIDGIFLDFSFLKFIKFS